MNKYKYKKIFIFDVDGTIAESYGYITDKNAENICKILKTNNTVIFATSRSKESVEKKVINKLQCDKNYYNSIYILPAGGALMYKWNEKYWQKVYGEYIDKKDIQKITNIYKDALKEIDPEILKISVPDIVNKKGTMLSCSALPNNNTKHDRIAWDPTRKKREQIILKISKSFPHLSACIGGFVTIDITKKDVNKAYGLNKLFRILKLEKKDAVFFGNGFYDGGNDYCVLDTGIDIISVTNPEDTEQILEDVLY